MDISRRTLLAGGSVLAADWPRFRGVNGTGVSPDRDLPVEFGPEKNLVWKFDVTGSGHSTPIVAGGRVFLTAAVEKERRVYALDAATGKLQWTQKLESQREEPKNRINSVATSTPFCDGNTVYVFFPDIGLAAFGVDGDVKWRRRRGRLQRCTACRTR